MATIVIKKLEDMDISFKLIDSIPNTLEDNVLYICDRYSLAIHKCMCGCNHKVINALDKEMYWEYKITYNKISMYPSIGNWHLNCRSHYWIRKNRVYWR